MVSKKDAEYELNIMRGCRNERWETAYGRLLKFINSVGSGALDRCIPDTVHTSGAKDKYAAIKNMSDDDRKEVLDYAMECSRKFIFGEDDESDGDTVSETKTDQLPTKAEAEIEAEKKALQLLKEGGCNHVYWQHEEERLIVSVSHFADSDNYTFSYRPEVEPPSEWNVVIDKQENCYISAGRFGFSGHLMVKKHLADDVSNLENWYDIKTGNKSTGWQDDWTPDEFRKDANE